MGFRVVLLGGEAGSRAALADALERALTNQAPDVHIAHHQHLPPLDEKGAHHLTLLLAPHPASGQPGEAADAKLRETLQSAGIAFQVVHGRGAEGLQQALRAIGRATGRSLVAEDAGLTQGLGRWSCDNCSDPDCEHRLFTGLLARP